MLRYPIFLTWFASSYLLAYILLLAAGNPILQAIAEIMLLFSPLLIVALAWSVIKHGKFDGRELKEGEEFGYSDRP